MISLSSMRCGPRFAEKVVPALTSSFSNKSVTKHVPRLLSIPVNQRSYSNTASPLASRVTLRCASVNPGPFQMIYRCLTTQSESTKNKDTSHINLRQSLIKKLESHSSFGTDQKLIDAIVNLYNQYGQASSIEEGNKCINTAKALLQTDKVFQENLISIYFSTSSQQNKQCLQEDTKVGGGDNDDFGLVGFKSIWIRL